MIQWRGVPFAAPPVGPLRFRPPEAPPVWDGERDASRFGPAAPQPTSPLQGFVGGQGGTWSEDCLYLNVFAPAEDGGGRPVMVWIHGGAFIGGSGSARWFDGSRFASEGAVVVTLNYRLGALGFLELDGVAGDGYRAAGNCGILDQLAALRWVRDNIESFGGDPEQVTVFGESAGAMSIGVMLAMPAARGLFRGAILQSGAASAYRTKENADEVTDRLFAAFGGSFDELAAAPAERIIDAQATMARGSDAASYLAFRPVVDGIDVPEPPDAAIAAGRGLDVALLVGTNRDEMTLFLAFDPGVAALTEDQLNRRLTAMVGADRWQQLQSRYRAAGPTSEAAEVLVTVTTDLAFRVPALRLVDAMATQDHRMPVWMYRLDWPSPGADGRLGATHGLDIPFVWGLLDMPGVELFTGTAPGRHQLAQAMGAAWFSFAATGDPCTSLLPEWPPYQPPRRATMIFDAECRVVDDPDASRRQIWEGIG